jgi:transcription antitermination factor NusG
MEPRVDHWPWFAIHVRSKQERIVSHTLRAQGYDEFLPVLKVTRTWSDRTKQLEEPLFPGYLFCRLNFDKRLPVMKIPGVVSIVGFGNAPFPVSQREVEAVQTVVRSGLPLSRWSDTVAGTAVEIDSGPLAGICGTLVEFKSHHRLVVSVTILQRNVAVEIEASTARPISQSACQTPLPRTPLTAPGAGEQQN